MSRLFVLASCVALTTAACGDKHMLSPVGPSAGPSTAAFDAGSPPEPIGAEVEASRFEALGEGKGNDNSNNNNDNDKEKEKDNGSLKGDDEALDNVPAPRGNGMLSGFVMAVSATSLTVRGITVVIEPATEIRHGNRILTMADIQIGNHVEARGPMVDDQLIATEIKVQDMDRAVELEEAVGGLTGTCPALTFTLGTTTVATNAGTVFDDVTCALLANGATVRVTGVLQATGTLLASEVELESGPDEVEGRVSGTTGTCPLLTLTVGKTIVKTSAATTFADGLTCATVVNGIRIEVEGTLQADGSIAAASVELD